MTVETREKILETAARLFHEQGYYATGIATILREAGANAGSLYHFFPNKEALLAAVLERYFDLIEPVVLGPQEEAEPDPIERVFALMDWYRGGLVATGCRLGCPIGNLALELSDSMPAIRPLIEKNFQGWCAGVERWFDEAGDRLPDECDRASLARFTLTVMEGGLMQARASGSVDRFDQSVAVLRDHIERLQLQARQGG